MSRHLHQLVINLGSLHSIRLCIIYIFSHSHYRRHGNLQTHVHMQIKFVDQCVYIILCAFWTLHILHLRDPWSVLKSGTAHKTFPTAATSLLQRGWLDWRGWRLPGHDPSATSSRLNESKMDFKLKQLKNLPSIKNHVAVLISYDL